MGLFKERILQQLEEEKANVNFNLSKEDICEECGQLWNSEFHMSDKCVNINEDY